MKIKLLGILVACVAVCAFAYDGLHLMGVKTITNTVTASGGSSETTVIVAGCDMVDRDAMTGVIIVYPSETTLRGYGLLDSCWIVVKSSLLDGPVTIDSTFKAALPCTAYVAVTGIDTLFKSDMYVSVNIADSSADSTFTADHVVKWDIVVR